MKLGGYWKNMSGGGGRGAGGNAPDGKYGCSLMCPSRNGGSMDMRRPLRDGELFHMWVPM